MLIVARADSIEDFEFTQRIRRINNMKTAEAYYIPDPVQIYVYIDEKKIKELPENAVLICKVESSSDLVKAVESYFILGSGS